MKKLLSVLLLAALGLSLLACGSTPAGESFPGGSVFLDARNGIDLRIVRSDGADDRVILAAMQIRETLRTLCGADVDLCSDWSRAGDPGHTGPEIHVGVTSCTENAPLLEQLAAETEDCYYIRSVGNKIFLLATGEDLLDEAVARFLADFVKADGDGVYIARDISLWVSADGRIDLVRGGVSAGGILLPSGSGAALTEAADRFSVELETLAGEGLPVYADSGNSGSVESAKIRVSFDRSLDPAAGEIDTVSGYIRVRAGSEQAAIAALSELLCFVTASPEVTWNGALTVYYPIGHKISAVWEHSDIPFPFGATLLEKQSISGDSQRIVFAQVSHDRFSAYQKALESAGLPLVYGSGKAGSVFSCDKGDLHLQVNYDESAATLTLYITRY